MAAKLIFVLCAHALYVQTAFSQCYGRGAIDVPAYGSYGAFGGAGIANLGLGASGFGGYGLDGNGLVGNGLVGDGYAGNGLAIGIVPTSGGALPISSTSAIAPVGLSVESENVYEGTLLATGELPFLSTVGLEAVLPSGGVGVVNHACGSGVGIAAESIAPGTYANAGAYGIGAGYGIGTSYGAGAGYGRGAGFGAGAAYGLGAGRVGSRGRSCGCGRY